MPLNKREMRVPKRGLPVCMLIKNFILFFNMVVYLELLNEAELNACKINGEF